MKLLLVQLFICIYVAFAQEDWETFKATYNKVYKDAAEENTRKQIFLNNLQVIEEHNRKYQEGLSSYSVKVNKFADFTKEELFYSSNSGPNHEPGTTRAVSNYRTSPRIDVPDSIDWRDYGVVTPVSDQSMCNSCWAFAVVGTVEAHVGIYQGRNVSLSQQNLEDCVDPAFTCAQELDRHAIENSYKYIIENNGIDLLESYPYEYYTVGDCRYQTDTNGAQIKSYGNISPGDEEELKTVVGTIGPVTVSITTDFTWSVYQQGVYYKQDCMNVSEIFNHAVVVVGYGTENEDDYWIVKNSWGAFFGDNGYIKMARNRDNNCGIASIASYPLM